MKIGVITQNNSNYGLMLLDALKRNNIPIDTIIIIKPPLVSYIKKFFYYSKRIGLIDTMIFSIKYLRSNFSVGSLPEGVFEISRNCRRYSDRLFYTQSLQDDAIGDLISEQKLDLLLLGQSGIIPKNLIAAPALGILNAHPGILPDYQGLDPFFWAIYNDDFKNVGSTLHFVNEGIDTGAIILREPYKWRGDETTDNLEFRLYRDCIGLMIRGVRCIREKTCITEEQHDGRYYSLMNHKQMATVSKKLTGYLKQTFPEGHTGKTS